MKLLLSVATCLVCLAHVTSSAIAQAPPTAEQQVVAADEALSKAIVEGDVEAYARMSAEEFVYVANGNVVDRAQRLDIMKRAGRRPGSTLERSVRVYGDAAVVQGLSKYSDRPPQRYTRVWIKRDGMWKTVANHSSSVTPAK